MIDWSKVTSFVATEEGGMVNKEAFVSDGDSVIGDLGQYRAVTPKIVKPTSVPGTGQRPWSFNTKTGLTSPETMTDEQAMNKMITFYKEGITPPGTTSGLVLTGPGVGWWVQIYPFVSAKP